MTVLPNAVIIIANWTVGEHYREMFDVIQVSLPKSLGKHMVIAIHFGRQLMVDLRTREPKKDLLMHIEVARDLRHDLLLQAFDGLHHIGFKNNERT